MNESVNKPAAAGTTAESTLSEKLKQIKESMQNGKMTYNQARLELGLHPIDSPGADQLLEKLDLIIS